MDQQPLPFIGAADDRPHPNSRKATRNGPAPNEEAARRRRKRIEEGEAQRAAEAAVWPGSAPTRSEIMIPLLRIVSDSGIGKPADVAEAIADELGIPADVREATAEFGGRSSNLWHRTVRWAMQDGKRAGYLFAEERGSWKVTQAGNEALGRVRTGVRLVVFRTALGEAVAAIAQEAAAIVEPGSVQTLFTSPLFPLCSKDMKSYGSMDPAQWLPWMLELLHGWLPLMREDGVIGLHLGQTHYRGMPAISNYRERFVLAAQDDLGLYRMPDLFWENPSRLPSLQWGAVAGMTPRPTVDPIYLLSKTPFPFMDAGGMREERDEPMRSSDQARGHETRPSGLKFGPGSFAGNKTPFPPALVRAGGSSGAEGWRKRLKEENLPAHPCPMPLAVPRFVIGLTSRPGDLVLDPFLGSATTAAAAEEMGRRWIGMDHHRTFLEGAALRPQFTSAPGYERMAA